jgi:hypothetical protein
MLLIWKYSSVQMIAHFVQIMCVRISTIKYHFSLTWTKHGWHGECLFLFSWNFKQFLLWKYKSKLFVSVSVQFFGKKIYMWAPLTKIPRFVLICFDTVSVFVVVVIYRQSFLCNKLSFNWAFWIFSKQWSLALNKPWYWFWVL